MHRVKTPEKLFFPSSFGHCGLSRLRRAKEYVNAQLYSGSLCECVQATALGNSNGERSSQRGQLTADSDGELCCRKSLSHRSPLFQNNSPVVRLCHVYE